MNRGSAFRRKIVYLAVLVVMLVPLFLLGQPVGTEGDGGGQLAEMRGRFDIAESDLGEISPASETMKLASLGLRGVAATLLWNKAHEYRVRHEWDRLKAALNNIALLQPHFDKVWEFQAWNLAYNVSSEFDDYRQRYEMVREGTQYLTRGVRQNRNASRLVWYTGWFYGQKIGMSDEKRQFRRLFAEDEQLHEHLLGEGIQVDSPEALGPLGKPDNWLVGRLWLYRGYDLVDSGVKIRRQSPINFYETGPKWRFNHAEAIEKEGVLDERAQDRWRLALQDWVQFGNRSIPTTASFTVKLDQIDELERRRAERIEEFRELTEGPYEAARQKKIAALTDEQRTLLERPESELSRSEYSKLMAIREKVRPNMQEIARKADPDFRLRAITLAGEIRDLTARMSKSQIYRDQINYQYWKTLAMAEQEERTVRARRLIYQAEQANEEAELEKAISLYEEAFETWAEIFDDYPVLVMDESAEDIFDSVKRYLVAIDSEQVPDDFPLKTFIDLMGEEGEIRADALMEVQEAQDRRLEEKDGKKDAADGKDQTANDKSTLSELVEATESRESKADPPAAEETDSGDDPTP